MIRLSYDNLWVRLGRITYGKEIAPDLTNICSVFWRGLGGLVMALYGCAFVGFLIAVVVSELIYAGLLGLLWLALSAVGVFLAAVLLFFVLFACGMGIETLWKKRDWRKPKMPRLNVKERVSNTVPAQAFKSWKERHCALVRIED